MKTKIKLKIPNDFYYEQWIKENALLLSLCCNSKIIFYKDKCFCAKCKLKATIIN